MGSPTTVDHDAEPAIPGPASAPSTSAPVVIEARHVEKTFRLPQHRVDSFKERAVRPFTRMEYRELRALRDISFDVHRGEFFGIVGRNGSGKSSLLKILASIYRADAGSIRMAGKVAPFIELGVGFNPDLSGRQNIVLNGVLMGLSTREARRRLDAVLDFGGLRDFGEVRLKNYSSGMMVRLAFAIMVQADADIMLIDEVLAVGDAAFAQKCMDVFHEKRRAGKTVVLVTHDMESVQNLCHRAMLIQDGELQYIGDPEETALRYFRLNFAGPSGKDDSGKPAIPDLNGRVVHAHLLDERGERIDNVEQGMPIILDVSIEARRQMTAPLFVFHVRGEDGTVIYEFTRRLDAERGDEVAVGERLRLAGQIENTLLPGAYSIQLWIRRDRAAGDMAVQGIRLLDFVVYGTAPRHGIVTVRTDVQAFSESAATP